MIIQHADAGALALNLVAIADAVPLPRRQTAGALRLLADAVEQQAAELDGFIYPDGRGS